jgi:hypothetical protein
MMSDTSLSLPRFKMDKGKGKRKRKRNSSRNSTPDTEATAPESLVRGFSASVSSLANIDAFFV